MKKAIWTIVVIICVIVVILLALPKYFSSQNQAFVQNFINGVQLGSNGQITGKIVKAANGWFSADSTVEFDYKIAVDSELTKKSPITGNLILQLTNYYGPLLFTHDGLKFGQTYIEYTVNNNEQLAKYFKTPLIQGTTLIDFTGNANVSFLGLNALTLPNFQFDGLKATAVLNKNVTQISGIVNYGHLQVSMQKSTDFTLTIQPFTQQFNLNRITKNDFWNGTKDLELPSITIKSDDFNGKFDNTSFKSNVSVDQDFFNGTFILSIPTFTINSQTGNYQATLSLKNLNARVLKQMYTLAKNFNVDQATEQQKQMYAAQLSDSAVDLFTGKSISQFSSTLNLDKLGNIIINAGYDNTMPLSKINLSAKAIQQNNEIAGVDLNFLDLNKSALGKIFHTIVAIGEKVDSGSSADSAEIQQLQVTLRQLFSQLFAPTSQIHLNVVLPESSKSGFQLLDAIAYFKQLPQNPTLSALYSHVQLDANWKIPTYATDLLKAFGPIIISKMQDPEDQALANNVYNIFQQMFPQLVQQGYLTQVGNYYLSTWNITSQAALMNNKPIQPLIQQLLQQQQQQTNTTTVTTPTPTTSSPTSVTTKPSVPTLTTPTKQNPHSNVAPIPVIPVTQ